MTWKAVKLRKEIPAGCAGEGKREKEIRRREKDGFNKNRQQHFVKKARIKGVR